jgi:ABC-type sugar transport system ATPase subunit
MMSENSTNSRRIGEVILDLHNISLAFGGVRALTDISFDVREHEIRAIIGPNGAGKSSMLNVINGVYRPQQGEIIYRGEHRRDMDTHAAAKSGIARTFQNIALFKGMTVLDNIMTGRNLKMQSNFLLQALYIGPARREEIEHRMADCASSPYFAVAAALQAALLGVSKGYALPPPETNDGLETINTDRHTPHSLGNALEALDADLALKVAVGAPIIDNFIAIKREEVKILEGKSVDEQIAYYLHFI